MIDFEPWMYPLVVVALVLSASRIIFWRLDQSERRWRREHAETSAQLPAE